MRSIAAYIISFMLVSWICGDVNDYAPENLTRVSEEELINDALAFKYPDSEYLTFIFSSGDTVSLDSLQRIKDPSLFALHYYKNDAGQIIEAVVVRATEEEKLFQERYVNTINQGPEFRKVNIDCANKVALLQEVFERDQSVRGGNKYDKRVDHENLETMVSYLDKCGMPSLEEVDEVQMAAIWAVIQHSNNTYRTRYLPMFEAAATSGDLSWSTIATIKDKIAVDSRKPQRYGTQVYWSARDGAMVLHELENTDSVDYFRSEVGLPPLDESLLTYRKKMVFPEGQ